MLYRFQNKTVVQCGCVWCVVYIHFAASLSIKWSLPVKWLVLALWGAGYKTRNGIWNGMESGADLYLCTVMLLLHGRVTSIDPVLAVKTLVKWPRSKT